MIASLINQLLDLFGWLGYTGIFVLMALESSLFPVPSELVMIPAGYLISTGKLAWIPTILAGAFGSLLGATANYLLGKYIGKPFIEKYGKYFFIKLEKYQEAEELFDRNAGRATFIGRFIPVIRHLISIPAGIFWMPYGQFAFLTTFGAGIWCAILVVLGYVFGQEVMDIVARETHIANYVVVVALLVGVIYFFLHSKKKGR